MGVVTRLLADRIANDRFAGRWAHLAHASMAETGVVLS
jgi:hypothetical protein